MRDIVITPELLLHGYASGVFPMAESREDPQIHWVDPRFRGVLPLEGFHISRSLARRIRRMSWRVTTDRDFQGVLDGCADRAETWINQEIRSLYLALAAEGFAHSIELWEGDELVGGSYGVALGAAWFGESMFSRRRDASKVALAFLTTHLRACGFQLFDTQFLTPHLASLGGIEVARGRYHRMLKAALAQEARFTALDYCSPAGSSSEGGSSTVSGGV